MFRIIKKLMILSLWCTKSRTGIKERLPQGSAISHATLLDKVTGLHSLELNQPVGRGTECTWVTGEKRGNWLHCLFLLQRFLLRFISPWQHIVTDVKKSLKVH